MKLFPFQRRGLDETSGFNRVAYYWDMGLGKTFVGAEKALQFGQTVLLVCQKSKIDDWSKHFLKHYEIVPYELTNADYDFEWFFGRPCKSKRGGNVLPYPDPMKVGIINYDLIFRRKDFLTLKDFTLVLDESSQIQNEKAKRTKFILKMKPDNVILLSGTPTSGKYENLWAQARLLGWDISQKVFNRHYVNWRTIEVGGFPMKIVDKANPYKNVDRLKAKFREYGAVFLKTDEVCDLPEQNFIEVNVPATKEYKRFQKDKVIEVGGVQLVGDSKLKERLYSRMLCGHFNPAKLEAFRDLCASTNDRLIVFYNFDAELETLRQICRELEKPVSEMNGHFKDLAAYETEENAVTLVQYQAGAMGLNLQKANRVIYFTPTDKCENWQQSVKRVHRIGQERPCFYYQLICDDSIEADIYKALRLGVDYTDYLFEKGRGGDEQN